MAPDPEPASAAPAPGAATPAAPPRRSLGRWRWLVIAATLLAVYAALGFLVAPRVLRAQLQARGTAALRREVTVAEVKVNPFTLAITIRGLEVKDLDAPRLAGWESLYVRLAPWKVLRGAVGVAEIHLVRPSGRLALDRAGRLNVQDLLGGDAPAPQPPPATQDAGRPLTVALDRLQIDEATLVFVDGSRTPAFETTLGPLSVKLTDFRTHGGADSPYAFSGATELGETFSWSGTVLTDPLRSSGTIAFSGIQLPKYDPYLKEQGPGLFVESGKISLEARYRMEWGAAARTLSLSGLHVLVEDLALDRRRDRSRAGQLPKVEVSGGEVDVLAQAAAIAEVKVVGARLRPRRDADGRMALLEMLELPPPDPKARPWRWSVGTISVERAAVEAEDLVPARPVRLSLPEVNVRLSGLTDRPDVACPLTASVRWGEKGTASASGTVWPYAARAELAVKADALDLAPLGPYLDGAAPVRLAAAALGLAARATVDAGRQVPAWTFAGDVRLDGLSLRHPARDEELVRWRSLEVLGVDAASAKARASVRTVRLTEPRVRAIVFEDGTTGLGPAKTAEPAAAPAAPAPPQWRTSIGTFQVVRGRASFTDRSIQPPVLLALTDVEAKVASLSSDPRVRSTVDVRAKVDGAAPVTVTGTVNPLQAVAYTDLAVAAKGIDLTPLEPYAGKHLGYGLQKGKLDLDLEYEVEEKAIHAGNVIRVDQLTLGEATHSPDATKLPVRLALALLKDRDGLILLDVPVEGRTDDPEFRLGRVIWRAVLNLVVKVATSPFSVLSALAGGGEEDISLVEFVPGSAQLGDQGKKRIELLAKSLAQRPGLSLELEPTVDAEADGVALRRAELERRLRRAKAATMRRPPAEDAIDALELAPDERPRLVTALYAATFPPGAAPKPASGATAAPPAAAEQEARLVQAMPLRPEDVPALLAARQTAARDALLAAGVEPGRVFLVQGGERAGKEGRARVYFTVR